jgi:hypothetical protein
MTEQEINQICDKCNQYIREHYQGKVCTYAQMYHVVHSDEQVRLNGCSKEWATCGIRHALVKVTANVVYRRNGTSANTSLRVEVRHFPGKVPGLTGWQENTCLAGIKFSASLKWPTIQKKLDSMIRVAMENQGLVCMPRDCRIGADSSTGTTMEYRYTQDAAVARKFAEDNRDILLKFGRTVEENLRETLDGISKYLGGGNG